MNASELRPMSLGEVLDRTFSLYRQHFLLFVGVMAIPMLIGVAMNLFLFAVQGSPLPIMQPVGGAGNSEQVAGLVGQVLLGFWAAALIFWVVYGIALGATTVAVSEVYLGRSSTIRHAYDKIRGKFWRVMDLLISVLLRLVGALLLALFGGLFLVGVLAASLSFLGQIVAAIVAGLSAFVVVAGAFALVVFLMLRYGVSLPALILENVKAQQAMKRSVVLTKGRRGQIFLIGVLTTIISYIAVLVFQGPFWVASLIMAEQGSVPFWLNSMAAVATGLGGAVTGPLLMIALVVFYYDLRVRKEAFDLQLMMEALDHSPKPTPMPSKAGGNQ